MVKTASVGGRVAFWRCIGIFNELARMRSLLVLVLGLVCSLASAQVDSLVKVLATLPNDTSRLPVLTDILRATIFTEPDKALEYAAQYTELAMAGGSALQQAKASNFTGMCYSVKGEPAKALTHYLDALNGFERAGDVWYTAMAHNNIGSVHLAEQRMSKARTEFQAAFAGFVVEQDTAWQANTANNLANIFRAEGLLDSADAYYSRAGDYLERIGDREHAASARYNQGNICLDRKEHAEALAFFREAYALMDGVDDEQTRSMILTLIGLSTTRMGHYAEAEGPLRRALAIAVHAGFKKERSEAHEALSELYERSGRADSALVQMKLFNQWQDSVFSEERSAQIAEMQEKYESGKKDMELAENRAILERRSLTIKAIASGSALLLLAAVFAFRAYQVKKRTSEELAAKNTIIDTQLKEKELLVREIHHRVKNNLQTVSSLLSIQGRGITDEKAKEAVNDGRLRVKSMALIHQDLYREGDLSGVRMKEYVAKLVNGLVTSYGMGERVHARIAVEDIALDVDTAVPIGLVLNELVTNALKYAWPGVRSGELRVRVEREGERLFLSVIDDGVGSTAIGGPHEGASGFGLNMIRTFADKLKAEWDIERNEEGTTVTMSIRSFKLAH